jgi:hypothetical protein
MSAYKELNRKKKRLRDLENDINYNIYPTQIDIWNECSILRKSIENDEDLLNKYKSTIRDQKLNELGI